ncbi:hypothetical protein CDIK_4047 [Cucumispora dikerogammari]|nr:hypothetical protein CDIK_4047 [Cucumispora dikerogammari]
MTKYGMLYHKIHERAVNGNDFILTLKKINESSSRSGIDTIIFIMDNARIYHYRGMREDAEISALRINYLPPYSLFLNPIENVFSVWKNNVVRGNARSETQLRALIFEKFGLITTDQCGAFYRKMLGYLNRAEAGQEILE